MDLYFKRHDGQAVTCEDFYAAMRDANNADFSNFLLWYVIDYMYIYGQGLIDIGVRLISFS